MTLRRRSLLDGCCSKSPRRTGQTVNRRAIKHSIKQITRAAALPVTPAASGSVLFGAASKANLKVVVRVRPLNAREQESSARNVIEVVDEHMLVFDPKKEEDVFFYHGMKQRRDITKRQHRDQKFVFERVFGPDSTNQDIFESTTKDLLDTLLEGYNCSVFAYGATGAGKTFTMVGRQECPGITLLTLMELYDRIAAMEAENPGHSVEVAVSYLEVYNETVRDLLQPGKPLQVQESGQQVLVPGLSYHKPRDADHLMQLLAEGNTNRTQHPTDANAESSRSHAVFQVLVKQRDGSSSGVTTSNVSVAKLSMIDLAGSERGSSTGCKGARFREGANINRSLLALGNCINALADGKSHIPYRDSKLTRLLKDSLGGNCRSVMVAAVSMASTTFEDTFNTLRYSNRAKTIKTTLKKNQMSVETHVNQYVKIVETLKQEVTSLKQQLQEGEQREQRQARQYEATITRLQAQLQKYEKRSSGEGSPAPAPESCPDASPAPDPALPSPSTANPEPGFASPAPFTVAPPHNCSFADTAPPAPCAQREALLQQLLALSAQVSGLLGEWLEVSSYERKLQWRLYTARTKAARLGILVFAAYKLNKSISRVERTEKTLNDRLRQTEGRRVVVAVQLATAREQLRKMRELCLLHVQDHCSSGDMLTALSNDSLQEAVQEQEGTLLRSLLDESVCEVKEGHRLQCVLLHAVRDFHVHLHSSDLHTDDTKNIFQSVVSGLDEYRIAWADQQQQEPDSSDGGSGAGASNSDPHLLPPVVAWLSSLSETHSPQVESQCLEACHELPSLPLSTLRKSIMKGSNSVLNLHDTRMSPVAVQGIAGTAEELHQSTLANTLCNQRLATLPFGVSQPSTAPVIAQLVPTTPSATSSVDRISQSLSGTTSLITSDGLNPSAAVAVNSSITTDVKFSASISDSFSSCGPYTADTEPSSGVLPSLGDDDEIESPVLSSQSRGPVASTVPLPAYILEGKGSSPLPLGPAINGIISRREANTLPGIGLNSSNNSNVFSTAPSNIDTLTPAPLSLNKLPLQRQSATRNLIVSGLIDNSVTKTFPNSIKNIPGSRSGVCLSDAFAITPTKDVLPLRSSIVPSLSDLENFAPFSSSKSDVKSASGGSGCLNTTVDMSSGLPSVNCDVEEHTLTCPQLSKSNLGISTTLKKSTPLFQCSTCTSSVTPLNNHAASNIDEVSDTNRQNSTFTYNKMAYADGMGPSNSSNKASLTSTSTSTESVLNSTYITGSAPSSSDEGSGTSGDEECQGAVTTTRPIARQLVFESSGIPSAGERLQNSTFCVEHCNGGSDENLLPLNPLNLLEKPAPPTSVFQLDSKPQLKLKGILKNSNSNLGGSGASKCDSVGAQSSRSAVSRSQSVRGLSSASSTLRRNHSSLGKTGASSAQKSYAMRRVMSFKSKRFPNLAENQENLAPTRGVRLPSSASCSNLTSLGSSAPPSASKPPTCWRP